MSAKRRRSCALALSLLLCACGVGDGAGAGPGAGPGEGAAGDGAAPPFPTPEVPAPARCRGAPYPVLLAHGMAGFDSVGAVDYFYQVAADLRGRGEVVFSAQVTSVADSLQRGEQLAPQVDRALRDSGACKVNIIAHSQGGLDARYVISSKGYGDRVAALVTVGTPHRGSPVADAALGLLPGLGYGVADAVLAGYQRLTGAPGVEELKPSLRQLSTANMRDQFNPRNRDDGRVRYYSVAGRSNGQRGGPGCAGGLWPDPERVDLLQGAFLFSEPAFLAQAAPLPEPNDGMVGVTSARWGTFLGCVPADHGDEIGQPLMAAPDLLSGFYHKDLYRRLVQRLREDAL